MNSPNQSGGNDQASFAELFENIRRSPVALPAIAGLLVLIALVAPVASLTGNLMGMEAQTSLSGFQLVGVLGLLPLVACGAAVAARLVPDLARYQRVIDLSALALLVLVVIYGFTGGSIGAELREAQAQARAFLGDAVEGASIVGLVPAWGVVFVVAAGILLGVARPLGAARPAGAAIGGAASFSTQGEAIPAGDVWQRLVATGAVLAIAATLSLLLALLVPVADLTANVVGIPQAMGLTGLQMAGWWAILTILAFAFATACRLLPQISRFRHIADPVALLLLVAVIIYAAMGGVTGGQIRAIAEANGGLEGMMSVAISPAWGIIFPLAAGLLLIVDMTRRGGTGLSVMDWVSCAVSLLALAMVFITFKQGPDGSLHPLLALLVFAIAALVFYAGRWGSLQDPTMRRLTLWVGGVALVVGLVGFIMLYAFTRETRVNEMQMMLGPLGFGVSMVMGGLSYLVASAGFLLIAFIRRRAGGRAA